MFELLSYPFVQIALAAALVLAGIHAYLGFHIVSRGVIFVDLSLAQTAAFGAVVALLLGLPEHSMAAYLVRLGFTFVGAAIIALAKMRDERIPQEAFIGIIYAGFTAASVLLLAGRPEGTEELQHMFSGSLLTVLPRDLLITMALYAAIGFVHWLLRKRFFRISEDRAGAVRDGWAVGWWDFLFYALFGIVVTSSVHVAGVLLVFALLVVPPVTALLFTSRKGPRLLLGWVVAFAGSVIGILASLHYNLPVGPAIIVVLALLLVGSAGVRRLVSS